MFRRAVRRARQFYRAVFVRVRQEELALAGTYLSPAQTALFQRMARSDQRHCLDVFYTLYDAGYGDDVLLRAALLHDVGKSAEQLTVWHRVAVVWLQGLAPRWLAHLAADGRGWKAPFAVHVRHSQLSAQWATEAGCSSDTVALIRRHHEPDAGNERSAILWWADEGN
jgi:hypothetical protein